jgi:GxxExxY protein
MLKYGELTERVIKAFYNVYNTLGHGFLEKVYENALIIELQKMGLSASQQRPVRIFYDGQVVGDYFADLVVEELVIVELKAAAALDKAHEAQLLNYLRATDMEVGLLLNFGLKPEFRRKVFMNDKSSESDRKPE